MDEMWNILLVIGVIAFSLFKGKAKEAKTDMATEEDMPMPPTDEQPLETEATPVPWFNPKSLDELLRPIQQEHPKPASRKMKRTSPPTRHVTETSRANSKENPSINSIPQASGTEETSEEFAIHSTEEARKAIIWGEILQRKYFV